MRILISSHAFAPSIGGIETVSRLLAEEFVRMGHSVTVVSQTHGASREVFPFPVIRKPSFGKLLFWFKWCDVYWQNNMSLRTLWPAMLWSRPIVITHQGSYARRAQGLDIVHRLKGAVASRITSVAISRAVAGFFKTDSTIIPNPYDARLFTTDSESAPRPGDLIFLGRLVSEKGLDLLLESLACLRARELSPRLTVVGAGPELGAMQERAATLGLRDQVTFTGPKQGEELVRILRQHKILVVPSRYDEPFGIVALEGIACGCVVVGSSGGGLPEAIGPCGMIFPNGEAEALASILADLVSQPNDYRRLRKGAAQHLARFHPAVIANAYLTLFQSKLR